MKYLIAGLGNPGPDYENTRHNIGFMILDAYARDKVFSFADRRYAFVAWHRVKNKQLILIKPTTFMNLSGKAIRYWMNEHKIPLENILVITDDIALPLGKLRLRAKGGAGGHNGISSIIEILGTEQFSRLRFGIGGEFSRGFQSDHVLGEFTAIEKEEIWPKIITSCDALETFVLQGIIPAMNKFNKL